MRGGVLNKNTQYGKRKEQVGCWSDGPQSKPSNSQMPQLGEIEGPFLALGVPKVMRRSLGLPRLIRSKSALNLLLNFKQGSTKGCV